MAGDIRVLIVDDEALVRVALRVFLEAADGVVVAGEAVGGQAALDAIPTMRPDVVLMDVNMPGMGGPEATRVITSRHPDVRVLALTTFSGQRTIAPMVAAGAAGFLVKDTEPAQIVAAIRAVMDGTFVLSPTVVREAFGASTAPTVFALGPGEALTPRELEVLPLLVDGLSNAEMATVLFVTEATIKARMSAIMTKWHAHDRTAVVVRAARAGLVTL